MRTYRLSLFHLFIATLIAAVLVSCGTQRTSVANSKTTQTESRHFMVLSINDVYRINGLYDGKEGGLPRIRTIRTQLEAQYPDMLFLHAGDFLFPSLLSGTYNGRQMISIMNLLDGKEDTFDDRFFVTFGNHEFEKARMKDTALLEELIEASEFHWLGSNIQFSKNVSCDPVIESENIIQHAMLTSNGVKVGVFSLTSNVKHPAYVESFGDPVSIAEKMTAFLRKRGAEVVVALTHLSVSEDKHLLDVLGDAGPDLILGGHEHDQQSHQVNGRWVIKANADATSAVIAKVILRKSGPPEVQFELKKVDGTIAQDPVVQNKVDWWRAQYDRDYCKQYNLPEGCTTEKYSFAQVDLIAEEIQIRKYETNLGNWVADQALKSLASEGAQIAFINSGSIRLNQNILKGDAINRSHINEMFPYNNKLKLIRITGSELQQVVDRAVTDWTGNGWWLQIAGFAFTFNPETGRAENLTLLDSNGPRKIQSTDTILAVTGEYLLDPGGDQDGYKMLTPAMVISTSRAPELTGVIIDALKANHDTGIAPQVEGRICNSQSGGLCLAVRD